jgi:hypothetical protein
MVFLATDALNLTTTSAADTVAANCAAQGFSRGNTESELRSSWSARETSTVTSSQYVIRNAKTKVPRMAPDGYSDQSVIELTQSPKF